MSVLRRTLEPTLSLAGHFQSPRERIPEDVLELECFIADMEPLAPPPAQEPDGSWSQLSISATPSSTELVCDGPEFDVRWDFHCPCSWGPASVPTHKPIYISYTLYLLCTKGQNCLPLNCLIFPVGTCFNAFIGSKNCFYFTLAK
jgi:hypothetical protein